MELKLRVKQDILAYQYDGDHKALFRWMFKQILEKTTSGNNSAVENFDQEDKSCYMKHGPGMYPQKVEVGNFVVCCPITGHMKVMWDPRKIKETLPSYATAGAYWDDQIEEFDKKFEIIK